MGLKGTGNSETMKLTVDVKFWIDSESSQAKEILSMGAQTREKNDVSMLPLTFPGAVFHFSSKFCCCF